MSIYIKGMEMPKDCGECFVGNRTICSKQCPLVEVPEPHGRLIDADKLKKEVLMWMPSDPCGIAEKEYPIDTDIVVSLMMEVEEAPTVIERSDVAE